MDSCSKGPIYGGIVAAHHLGIAAGVEIALNNGIARGKIRDDEYPEFGELPFAEWAIRRRAAETQRLADVMAFAAKQFGKLPAAPQATGGKL